MTDPVAALSQFKTIATEAYLSPPSSFLIVGDELLVSGELRVKRTQSAVISLSPKANPTISLREFAALYRKVRELASGYLAEFKLSKTVKERLSELATKLDSTHVRFFNHPERGIVARLFDVRVGSDALLPRNRRIYAAATVNVSRKQVDAFSITLTVEALSHLPTDDMLISIYADGILEAEPVNSKLRHSIMCRDQGIAEPYTRFEHETLKRSVYFVSHPRG